MDEENPGEFLKEFLKDKPKIWIRQDSTLRNAYDVYGRTLLTVTLPSEQGRTVLAESCKIEKDPNFVERLQDLCVAILAKTFKGGYLDERIQNDNLALFTELLDVETPIEHLIYIEDEAFWKRVVKSKSKCLMDYYELIQNLDSKWKSIGVSLKLAELIHETCPEDWDVEKLREVALKIAPYVENLEILYMKPLKKFEHRYEHEKIDYVPIEVCHHGSLEFLQLLNKLQSLSLMLKPNLLFKNYKREFFECSYEDIQNLANGIKSLSSLKKLRITNTRLDSIKIDTIFNSFQSSVQLTHIDLSNCTLTDDAAISLGFFIAKSKVLEYIELQGNLLDKQGARCIAYGLQNTTTKILYLGLGRNPIGNEGIKEIAAGLIRSDNVTELNINGIDIHGEGPYRISQIVQMCSSINKLNISCIKFSDNSGNCLIAALKGNKEIIEIECRGCDLSEKQEFDVKILTERNKFYKENSCMMKDTFTKADEIEIDKWFQRVKQPLYVEMNQTDQKLPKNVNLSDKNQIPEELKKRIGLSNAELLGVDISELYCMSTELIQTNSSQIKESHVKEQDEKQLLASKLRTLESIDLNPPYYF